jgi:lysophospholipase L1-like esterase
MNKLLVIIICLLSLSACESDSPRLAALPADAVILAFGDSLTTGVGTTKSKSYPSVLADLTGLQVVNAGVSGETTAQGLKRLSNVLNQSNPNLVILIEGGNDILRGLNLAQAKNNLRNMIMLIKERNIAVVLIGVPEKSLFLNAHPMYAELANEFQLVFDNNLLQELFRNAALKSDIVHLNEMGYKKMAESIYILLQEQGAL